MGGKTVTRYVLALCAGAAFAALAWSQTIRPGEMNGGGAVSFGATFRLAGVIVDQGVSGATPGISQNASNKVSSGFFPAIGPLVMTRNLADPAWLRVARTETRPGALEMTAWREPETSSKSFDLTGWQL